MTHRVLIVEDDRSLRTFLHKAFREEGYVVDEAATGDEGFAAAVAGEHSCIVLDRSLPGRDGMAELRNRAVGLTAVTRHGATP